MASLLPKYYEDGVEYDLIHLLSTLRYMPERHIVKAHLLALLSCALQGLVELPKAEGMPEGAQWLYNHIRPLVLLANKAQRNEMVERIAIIS
jgi:hypothetical protein